MGVNPFADKVLVMVNGNLSGLACDSEENSAVVQVHPVGFFDHITSNLVVNSIYFTPGDEEQLYGGNSQFIETKTGEFVTFIESNAAIAIGSSSLVMIKGS